MFLSLYVSVTKAAFAAAVSFALFGGIPFAAGRRRWFLSSLLVSFLFGYLPAARAMAIIAVENILAWRMRMRGTCGSIALFLVYMFCFGSP